MKTDATKPAAGYVTKLVIGTDESIGYLTTDLPSAYSYIAALDASSRARASEVRIYRAEVNPTPVDVVKL